MKNLLLISMLLLSGTAFAESYVCNSRDYNPDNYEGQSLTITRDHLVVTEVRKNAGSWFSDDGVVVNPKLISKTASTATYEIDFKDDSYNGRLTVYLDKPIKKAVYAFSYANDEGNRRDTSVLECILINN